MKALPKGQYIKHFQYGVGVITESDEQRTSIDFDIHGMKELVTNLMVVDPAEGTPPKTPASEAQHESRSNIPSRSHRRRKMSESAIVQYVGCEAKASVREYSFLVRQPASELREFTLTIVNEAFDSHRVRYQDAPDICSLKLHRELAASANHPPQTHYRISEVELEEYRGSHTSKAAGKLYRPKAAQEL